MDVFSLVARLSLNSEDYDKGLDNAKDKAGGLGSTLKKGLSVAGAAIGVATTAVTAFAGEAVKVGADFDQSMSQVAATMGTTVDAISELRDFAQEMGSTTAFSATQAADALNYMALAGYDADTSMAMLPNVLNLAAAGGIELAAASDMVTDAQSALGLSLDETAELVDKMAKASSKSNTSVAQLGDAILTVGGTAKNLAGGTTELSAALGVLADNGIKGAEGGTALRNVILALSAPTDTAAKKMAELGLETYDAAGNLRPIEDIFLDLNDTLSTMTQGEQTEVLNTLFNKVDLKSANALLATSAERWDELSGAIDDASGAAQAMAETQLDNLNGDITLFKSALEGAQIAISDGLTPSLREFVQFGTDGITRLTEAFKEQGLSGAMDALGTVLSDGLAMIINYLPQAVSAGVELLKALIKGIIDNLPQLADAAIEILLTITDAIIENVDELIPAVAQTILTIVQKLTEPETLEKLVEAAIQLTIAIAKGLIEAVPYLLQAVVELFANLLYAIGEEEAKLFEAGANIVKNLWEGLKSAIDEAKQWGRDLIDNFVQGIKDRIQHVVDTVKDVAQKVKDFLGFSEPKEGPLSNFHTYAPDMMKLFAQGIRDNERLITDQINKSFDFGTRTADFAASGIGQAAFGAQKSGYGAAASSIQLEATINLDGNELWRGILPVKNRSEAFEGVPLIGY